MVLLIPLLISFLLTSEEGIPEEYLAEESPEEGIPEEYLAKEPSEVGIPEEYLTQKEGIPKEHPGQEEIDEALSRGQQLQEAPEEGIPGEYPTKEAPEERIPMEDKTQEVPEQGIPAEYTRPEAPEDPSLRDTPIQEAPSEFELKVVQQVTMTEDGLLRELTAGPEEYKAPQQPQQQLLQQPGVTIITEGTEHIAEAATLDDILQTETQREVEITTQLLEQEEQAPDTKKIERDMEQYLEQVKLTKDDESELLEEDRFLDERLLDLETEPKELAVDEEAQVIYTEKINEQTEIEQKLEQDQEQVKGDDVTVSDIESRTSVELEKVTMASDEAEIPGDISITQQKPQQLIEQKLEDTMLLESSKVVDDTQLPLEETLKQPQEERTKTKDVLSGIDQELEGETGHLLDEAQVPVPESMIETESAPELRTDEKVDELLVELETKEDEQKQREVSQEVTPEVPEEVSTEVSQDVLKEVSQEVIPEVTQEVKSSSELSLEEPPTVTAELPQDEPKETKQISDLSEDIEESFVIITEEISPLGAEELPTDAEMKAEETNTEMLVEPEVPDMTRKESEISSKPTTEGEVPGITTDLTKTGAEAEAATHVESELMEISKAVEAPSELITQIPALSTEVKAPSEGTIDELDISKEAETPSEYIPGEPEISKEKEAPWEMTRVIQDLDKETETPFELTAETPQERKPPCELPREGLDLSKESDAFMEVIRHQVSEEVPSEGSEVPKEDAISEDIVTDVMERKTEVEAPGETETEVRTELSEESSVIETQDTAKDATIQETTFQDEPSDETMIETPETPSDKSAEELADVQIIDARATDEPPLGFADAMVAASEAERTTPEAPKRKRRGKKGVPKPEEDIPAETSPVITKYTEEVTAESVVKDLKDTAPEITSETLPAVIQEEETEVPAETEEIKRKEAESVTEVSEVPTPEYFETTTDRKVTDELEEARSEPILEGEILTEQLQEELANAALEPEEHIYEDIEAPKVDTTKVQEFVEEAPSEGQKEEFDKFRDKPDLIDDTAKEDKQLGTEIGDTEIEALQAKSEVVDKPAEPIYEDIEDVKGRKIKCKALPEKDVEAPSEKGPKEFEGPDEINVDKEVTTRIQQKEIIRITTDQVQEATVEKLLETETEMDTEQVTGVPDETDLDEAEGVQGLSEEAPKMEGGKPTEQLVEELADAALEIEESRDQEIELKSQIEELSSVIQLPADDEISDVTTATEPPSEIISEITLENDKLETFEDVTAEVTDTEKEAEIPIETTRIEAPSEIFTEITEFGQEDQVTKEISEEVVEISREVRIPSEGSLEITTQTAEFQKQTETSEDEKPLESLIEDQIPSQELAEISSTFKEAREGEELVTEEGVLQSDRIITAPIIINEDEADVQPSDTAVEEVQELEHDAKDKSDVSIEQHELAEGTIRPTATEVTEITEVPSDDERKREDVVPVAPKRKKKGEKVVPPPEGVEELAKVEIPAEPITEVVGLLEVTTEPVTEVEAPVEPSAEVEAPTEPITEVEAPTEAVTEVEASEVEAPAEPLTEVEAPAEPLTEVEAPAEPLTEVEAPAEPLTEVDAPAEPLTEIKAPTEPVTEVEAPKVEAPAEPFTEHETEVEPVLEPSRMAELFTHLLTGTELNLSNLLKSSDEAVGDPFDPDVETKKRPKATEATTVQTVQHHEEKESVTETEVTRDVAQEKITELVETKPVKPKLEEKPAEAKVDAEIPSKLWSLMKLWDKRRMRN